MRGPARSGPSRGARRRRAPRPPSCRRPRPRSGDATLPPRMLRYGRWSSCATWRAGLVRSAAALRPSIAWTRSMRSSSRVRYSPTSLPSRSTVTRSLISYTCSRKCDTKRIGDPALLEVADHAEQLGALVRCPGSRWVRPGRAPGRPWRWRERSPPAAARPGSAPQQRCRVDVEPEIAQHRLGLAAHRGPVDEPEPSRLASQRDVLGDRDVGQQVDLLVDRAHPGPLGLVRGRETHASCRRAGGPLRSARAPR